jgi:hypothetical protein
LRFVIISEHISFIPNNILDVCEKIHVKRPPKERYLDIMRQSQSKTRKTHTVDNDFLQKIANTRLLSVEKTCSVIESVNMCDVLNIKELHYLNKIEDVPDDIFNVICNVIIEQMLAPDKLVHVNFRDALYDILIYNLDVVECIWYILSYFIENDKLVGQDISDVLTRMYNFLKYFNNNYRPIYHLESIMHYMIIKIFKYDELPKGM